jgi:glutathione S-transferase
MKLYGHYISLTTLQVMALLAEKGASAELVLVDVFAGEQKLASHRALHPFGYIPVLDDAGFHLYETHAILRYLDSRLPGRPHIPADVQERAHMDQWLCIEQNYLLPAAKKVMAREYAHMMKLADPGPAVVKEGERELQFAIGQFADWIADKPYIAGDGLSLADLCWLADLYRMASLPQTKAIVCDVRAEQWWKRLAERAEWQQALAELASYAPEEALHSSTTLT